VVTGILNQSMTGPDISLENYPNPFGESTTISFKLPESAHVKMVILNMMGQTVNVLLNRKQSAGTYHLVWDGTDASGTALPGGIYIYRLSTDKIQLSRKMMLIR